MHANYRVVAAGQRPDIESRAAACASTLSLMH